MLTASAFVDRTDSYGLSSIGTGRCKPASSSEGYVVLRDEPMTVIHLKLYLTRSFQL